MARIADTRDDFGSGMLERIGVLEMRTGIKLGTLQKILLAETGTVEQLLSVLVGSRIKVNVTKQFEIRGVIARESVITNDSGDLLIRARSRIFTHNLPMKVISRIRSKREGIGTIIQSSRIETFRKILEIGYDSRTRRVFRKYQIVHKKKVAFEIREEFAFDTKGGPGGI
ncbi:MAG TPA: hypothetical protein VLA68_00935 [Nitrososphaera sp.]|nr:hypothetical protein [Nitrososphaera sp.]